MADKLKKLKKKIVVRDAIITGVKSMIGDVNYIYDNYSEENLESILQSIKTQSEKLDAMNEQIIELSPEDKIEKEVLETMTFEQFVNREVILLTKFIKKCSKNDSVSVSSSSSETDHFSTMKLPKLEVKSFNGDPTTWQSFYDSFSCAVHENKSLSNVQKMNYLINFVQGSAAETIKGLALKNDNYEIALNMLKERYGDDQVIISAHMNTLLNMT